MDFMQLEPKNIIKVSVLMPTYNHEQYIRQAIESFLSQECNFSIELLIGNDASTDNSNVVISEYAVEHPDKIRMFNHQQNIGLLKNYKTLMSYAKGEYIAILESDDYWISPHKLQSQVDYLDQHADCGLVFSEWMALKNGIVSKTKQQKAFFERNQSRIYEFLLIRNIIKSPTVCFRRSIFNQYCNIDEYIEHNFYTFDYPVWLTFAKKSRIFYSEEITAVYRYLSSSVSNNQSLQKRLDFEDNMTRIKRYIISHHGTGKLTTPALATREAVMRAKHAFRLKKPITGAGIFVLSFFKSLSEYILKTNT